MNYTFWLGEDRREWFKLSQRKPPINQQVSIRQKEAVGEVYDVACYTGIDRDGVEIWIMGDVRLESRQISHWAFIYGVV